MKAPTVIPAHAASDPDYDELVRTLVRMALVSADQLVRLTPLAGGVSSDIYRAELPSGVVCVKRALPRLRVAADWHVPVERNRWEVEWMRTAAGIVPDAVPAILGEDRAGGAFAMAWLPPEQFPVWKSLLAEGRGTLAMAGQVGAVLGRIHAATADRPDIAARFPTDALFHAIRLDPYLVTAARAHPDLGARLQALVDTTARTRRVLVHGDFSPKNILIGSEGPVILDAECAWYGDPAFDLAFVLNHLLLKGAWRPRWRAEFSAMFRALVATYRPHAAWEPWPALDARTAALLPGLLLARVDGKSPVEYVTDDATRNAIRRFARAFVAQPPATLEQLVHHWSA
jgi:aminoglycoside phosphotransferase (APT) family kinase protein